MVIAYRIAQERYIQDLSGYGAYLVGGRWNLPGTYVLYLAAHRSLAYLEYLVHQYDRALWPTQLRLATIEIKNDDQIIELTPDQLPENWSDMQYNVAIQQTCERFFRKGVFGLKVPSVVVPGEYNFALNPQCKPFSSSVVISNIEPANFDKRLQRGE